MSKELNYYFNGTAFNKLVYDAGYDGIKDFAERSGIPISYKTIKRACNDGHCTRRTFYAIACKLAEKFDWTEDPIGTLKTAFEIEQFDEEKCKNTAVKNKEALIKYKEYPEEVAVCLSNNHVVSIKGKSIYWDWHDYDSTIRFYDEGAENGEDLKIAEFDKAAVLGIIRQFKE